MVLRAFCARVCDVMDARGVRTLPTTVVSGYFPRFTWLHTNIIRVGIIASTIPTTTWLREERIMGWMTQPFYEKGLAEGEARGEVTGTAKALALLLEKRFGAIPQTVHERLFAADMASIETWLGRVLNAPDLQSVFSQH